MKVLCCVHQLVLGFFSVVVQTLFHCAFYALTLVFGVYVFNFNSMSCRKRGVIGVKYGFLATILTTRF